MAPTAEEVKAEIDKMVEERPGNVWAPDAMRTALFRRLKTTANCVDNRMGVLLETGELKEVMVRPQGYVAFEGEDKFPFHLPYFHPWTSSKHGHDYLTRGTISFERISRRGNLWSGDQGRYYYTSAEGYAAILETLRAAHERLQTARKKKNEEDKEAEQKTLRGLAPDAEDLIEQLHSALGSYSSFSVRGGNRLWASVELAGEEDIRMFLEILRRGLPEAKGEEA